MVGKLYNLFSLIVFSEIKEFKLIIFSISLLLINVESKEESINITKIIAIHKNTLEINIIFIENENISLDAKEVT